MRLGERNRISEIVTLCRTRTVGSRLTKGVAAFTATTPCVYFVFSQALLNDVSIERTTGKAVRYINEARQSEAASDTRKTTCSARYNHIFLNPNKRQFNRRRRSDERPEDFVSVCGDELNRAVSSG